MNFDSYVQAFQNLYLEAIAQPEPKFPSLEATFGFKPARKILIIAPHPDDECLMSGLALRAAAEWGSTVGVLPFSYGSKVERQVERKIELQSALKVLGFLLVDFRKNTLHELTVSELTDAVSSFDADVVILPHSNDGHATHVRCSKLAREVLEVFARSEKRTVHLFESEFWQSMQNPNLLIPLSSETVIQMGRALLCHVGEVERNPYHLTLPAWLMDQVRRGSEIKKGSAKKNAVFGQLYRHEVLRA